MQTPTSRKMGRPSLDVTLTAKTTILLTHEERAALDAHAIKWSISTSAAGRKAVLAMLKQDTKGDNGDDKN